MSNSGHSNSGNDDGTRHKSAHYAAPNLEVALYACLDFVAMTWQIGYQHIFFFISKLLIIIFFTRSQMEKTSLEAALHSTLFLNITRLDIAVIQYHCYGIVLTRITNIAK